MTRRLVLTRASDIPPERDHHRDYDNSHPCWCLSRLNDHGRRYRRASDNTPVVLWEPYDCSPKELAEVFAAAADDGLRVHVSGMSPWNPGATVCIAFVPEAGAPDAA